MQDLMLKTNFDIIHEEFHPSSVPNWIRFMIGLGSWMKNQKGNKHRIVLTLLLPTRSYCSAFASLGSILASAEQKADVSISWTDFLLLKEGTEVYFLDGEGINKSQVKGVVGDCISFDGTVGRKISITTKQKKYENAVSVLFENTIRLKWLSLVPHGSTRAITKASNVYSFYKNVVENLDKAWGGGAQTDTVIVTNKVEWKRGIEPLQLSVEEDIYNLNELLMISEQMDSSMVHTILASNRTDIPIHNDAFTILDGIESLSRWEDTGTSDLLILLDYSEFEEQEAGALLSRFSNVRDDSLLPNTEYLVRNIPDGTEVMVNALPKVFNQ